MYNEKAYLKGFEEFSEYGYELEEIDEKMDEMSWSAYYNDNCGIESIELGYFLLVETMGDDIANEYYKEYKGAAA